MIFVFPLLVLFLFATVELAFFWKNHTGVQNIASQVASYSVNYIDEAGPDFDDIIVNFLEEKEPQHALTSDNLTFSNAPTGTGATQFRSSDNRLNIFIERTAENPLSSEFDYVKTKVVYEHQTLLLKAEYALPNGEIVKVIPANFTISSSEVKQYSKF